MSDKIQQMINGYIKGVTDTIAKLPVEEINRVIDTLNDARINRNKVLIMGNGGSAATASHFASDLAKGAITENKPRIRAFAFTDNVSQVTAWANDSNYDMVFQEQVENYVDPGDVAIAISGSGNSPNVLNGIKAAKGKGATTIGFLGFDGGKARDLVDIALIAPVHDMEQAEDIHLIFEHIITYCLREMD